MSGLRHANGPAQEVGGEFLMHSHGTRGLSSGLMAPSAVDGE
jgi:hypothetical protein